MRQSFCLRLLAALFCCGLPALAYGQPGQYLQSTQSTPCYEYPPYGTGFGGGGSYQNSGFYSTAAPPNPNTYIQAAPQQNRQASSTANLQNALDAVDNPNAWHNTPVSVKRSLQSSRGAINGGQNTGMMPRVTRRDVARVMMEGGSLLGGAAGSSGDTSQASSSAYSYYMQAESLANKAHYQANQARYNGDDSYQEKAAREAVYYANQAKAAADKAYYAAQSGDSQAKSYASSARSQADWAMDEARRAQYVAD